MKVKKAFTLIELMLTVMVIAILVSIAVPNYINVVERARAREAMSTLQSMHAAEQSYAAERRAFISLVAGATSDWEAVGLEDPNANGNRSWDYTGTASGGGTLFDATATRRNGPYVNDNITIDESGFIDAAATSWTLF